MPDINGCFRCEPLRYICIINSMFYNQLINISYKLVQVYNRRYN